MLEKVLRYHAFEVSIATEEKELKGIFTCGQEKYNVKGFAVGDGEMMVRFQPGRIGEWNYRIMGRDFVRTGRFMCVEGDEGNSGMVRTKGAGFAYQDGTAYLPFGTTCYAWIYQPEEIRKQTVSALAGSPFNKLRMCIFPKDMIYNEEEPPYFPYERETGAEGKWDIGKPDQKFWEILETSILELDKLGVEADIILFHPYDRWGFSQLSKEDNLRHLEYCVARLSAYKNVWWSLANEYDLMPGWSDRDWDYYARKIKEWDPYGHLISIHNCFKPYVKADWMTHCSLQTADTKSAMAMRMQYKLPIIIDECGYEGDIPFDWGNLSAFELVHRIWMGCMRGGYCSHGETYDSENNRLWWSKGGQLKGESVVRIAFLKGIMQELPQDVEPFCWKIEVDPNGKKQEGADTPFAVAMMKMDEDERNRRILDMLPMALCGEGCWLQYLGRSCQRGIDVNAPGEGEFRAEVLDVWDMSRVCVSEGFEGSIHINLPAKEGMAVLLRKNSV